jgi:hypothetical protein
MFTDRTKLQHFGNNLANMCEWALTASHGGGHRV